MRYKWRKQEILMTDSSLGSTTGVTNHGIYNLEYLDSPATQEDVLII